MSHDELSLRECSICCQFAFVRHHPASITPTTHDLQTINLLMCH
jgi:hypothetical protein